MPKYNMLYAQISIHALRVEGDFLRNDENV